MGRYNNGVIFTNSQCIACNKCVSNCALMGANVSVVHNGKVHMEIDSRKCSDCGKCIDVCIHNARDFRDDADKFFKDLKKGVKISLILSPDFFAIYKENATEIIKRLRTAGVDKIYDGGYGREICAYLTAKYLKEAKKRPIDDRAFISNSCPALITVIQKYHPFLLPKLMPIQPPVMCSAIYAKKYLGDENKIAVLSACIANKDEVESQHTNGALSYNLTFAHVINRLPKLKDDSLSGELDLKALGFGSIVSVGGEFSDVVSTFFPRTETIISLHGFSSDGIDSLYLSLNEKFKDMQPLFAELSACRSGCISGPGIDRETYNRSVAYSNAIAIRKDAYNSFSDMDNPEKFWKQISSHFKYIRPDDFGRTYTDYSRQQFKVPQSAFDEIFIDMLKDNEQKQNINCGSCGYSSCKELAQAIAYGYSRKENCIHYMNDLLIKRYYTDAITGLMSREAFIREGNQLFMRNQDKNFIVAVGDVNKLKIINDLYGFATGNDALRQIAATLRQIAGEEGIVSRLGGGSFAICMENNVDNLQKLQSCKFFDSAALHISFPITMHFGIRIANYENGIGSAMDQASVCMDYSISSLQNTYTAFTQKNIERTHLEAEITSQMQPALDNGEFKIWFQPQYSSSTGEMVGAEALCRWIKEDGTIISPALFIPIAEKNGFIQLLDREIWTNVFAAVRSWLDAGIEPVPISINISRVSLESDKLYYYIKRLKENYNIPEHLIHFEITETAEMNSQGLLNERLGKIRSLGYSIAMDDFGSGYSSLNSLKDMPIDILKLDMGFMRGDDSMNRGGTIINYVVRMAQGLEYITVAEGVETHEQADFLRSIGVNVFQGFLYAKPMPEDVFVDLLKSSDVRVTIHRPRTFGQIDVRKFLSPDSPESLMFEDFTGAASIYEFDDKTESIVLIRANKKFLTMFEMDTLAFADVKKNLRKVISKQSFAVLIDSIKKAFNENTEVICESEVKTFVKENPRWLRSHVWEFSRNENRHSIYILTEDVTNEKITENTLAISNNQLGMMLDNSQVGMCLMHVNVNMKLIPWIGKTRVLRVNQMFTELSGFSRETVLNWTEKEALSVIHPLDRPGFMAVSFKAFVTKFKKPVSYDYRALTSEGKYVKVRIYATGVQQPDKSYMIITNYVLLDKNPKTPNE